MNNKIIQNLRNFSSLIWELSKAETLIVLIIVLVCGCGLLIQPCRDTFTVGATGSVSDNNAIRSGSVTEVCTGRKIGGTCNGLTPESNEFEGTCKKNKGEEEEGECGSPFSAGKNEEVCCSKRLP